MSRLLSSGTRLTTAAAVGVLAAVAGAFLLPWQGDLLVGWDGLAVTWLLALWVVVLRLDASGTRAHATREDPSRAASDGLVLAASAASLVAVALVTVKAAHGLGSLKAALIALSVFSIFTSWAAVHTLFTLRYAALYYFAPEGGINFHGTSIPTYSDFAYVAFTIGMTFQVSDTDLSKSSIRLAALRHALLSYLIGAVILAATINLVSGLVH